MDKDRIYIVLDLILKSWAGTLSQQEENELEELLANSEWAQLKKDLEDDRYIMGRFKEYEKYDSVTDFSFFLKRIRKKRRMGRRHAGLYRIVYVAACCLIFFMAGWLWVNESEKSSSAEIKNDLELARMAIDRNSVRLILPDRIIPLNQKKEVLHLDSIGLTLSEGLKTLDYRDVKIDLLKDSVSYHVLSIPKGCIQSIILSDSTRVILNAMSTLTYPAVFTGSTREIYLEGEALFEVKRDEKRPFVVTMKEFSVNVLGTTFNVMSYDDEPFSRVTLLTGKVETRSGDMTVLLKPGEQAILSQNKQIQVKQVDPEVTVSWVEQRFCFESEKLDVIMRKICRWYDVDVFYEMPAMRERRFTGYPLKNISLEDLLGLLSTTTDLQFMLNDGVITIKNF